MMTCQLEILKYNFMWFVKSPIFILKTKLQFLTAKTHPNQLNMSFLNLGTWPCLTLMLLEKRTNILIIGWAIDRRSVTTPSLIENIQMQKKNKSTKLPTRGTPSWITLPSHYLVRTTKDTASPLCLTH